MRERTVLYTSRASDLSRVFYASECELSATTKQNEVQVRAPTLCIAAKTKKRCSSGLMRRLAAPVARAHAVGTGRSCSDDPSQCEPPTEHGLKKE